MPELAAEIDERYPQRQSKRLPGYDYSQAGVYFVTLCTKNRACLFGQIVDGFAVLNRYGRIVESELHRTEQVRAEVELDVFVVMPNHLHAVVWLRDCAPGHLAQRAHDRAPLRGRRHGVQPPQGRAPLRRQARSLGSLIAGFKSTATKRINALRGTPGVAVWQRGFYERVIRSDRELQRVREYVVNNPLGWELDEYNPANIEAAVTPVGAHGRAPVLHPGDDNA